jgi:hypothetical protein
MTHRTGSWHWLPFGSRRRDRLARRRRATPAAVIAMQEQLEQRLAMAVTPTVAWSSYLGNAGVQSIEGAWVAPDDSVFIKWSDGPGTKSGLDRFNSNLVVNNAWATSLGKILTGSGNAGARIGNNWAVRPLGISQVEFGTYLDGGVQKPAIYVTGQTSVSNWVRNGFDKTLDPAYLNDTRRGTDIGADQTTADLSSQDGFVAKLSLDGAGVWSTYLGSNSREWVNGIVVSRHNGDDAVYVAGTSRPNIYGRDSIFNIRTVYNWSYSTAVPWVQNGFDTATPLPDSNDIFATRGKFFPGDVERGNPDLYRYGWTAKLNDAPDTSENPQSLWSTCLNPTGYVMQDAAGVPTGQTVTYDGKSGDFVWVDSQGFSWTVVDGQRLFKIAPDGRLDEVRSFRLIPKITAKVVSGNSAYFLGQDATGKNVVQKVILEDSANPDNNWTIPWVLDLGDITPACMAVDPAGDRVYLGGSTTPGQEVAGLVKSNGQVLAPIGTRQGPNDGYLIQLNTATGDPDYMMYIGGEGEENVTAIAAKADGLVWVMGDTDSRLNAATGTGPDAVAKYWIKGGVTNADVSYSGDRDGFVVAVKTDDRFASAAVAGKANIATGDATPSRVDGTDFGKAALGSPVSQVFTISNSGNGRLSLSNFSLPAGYTLVGSFPTSVAAGQSASFTLRLDAEPTTPLGVKTGVVSFTTSDLAKPNYSFAIQGEVVSQVLPEFSIANVSVVEGNSGTTPATFTVSLSAAVAAGKTASVDYRILAGTATAGRDYTVAASTGTLRFAAGESSKTVTVNVVGDRTKEENETLQVVLSNPSGGTILAGTASGTITDDDSSSSPTDGVPVITADALRLVEGSSGTKSGLVTVRLSAATTKAVTVQYVTADGTARSGSDYTRTTGLLSFAAGETSKTVTIPVTGDTLAEADETFTLRFSAPVNATLGTSSAVVTILNDDAAALAPPVTVSNVSIREGNTGRPTMIFTLALASPATATTTYTYGTTDGTAKAGIDYVAVRDGATVVFRPGQRTATVVVNAIANTRSEADRSFTLNVFSGGTKVGSGTGTIRDDDRVASLFAALAGSLDSSVKKTTV